MKKIISFFFLVYLYSVSTVSSQPYYFNKAYEFQLPGAPSHHNDGIWGRSVVPIDTSGFAFTGWSFSNHDVSKIIFGKINNYGDTLLVKHFGRDDAEYFTDALIRNYDGTYGILSSERIRDLITNEYAQQTFLLKIKENGDSIFGKIFNHFDYWERPFDMMATRDSGFAIVGWRQKLPDEEYNLYFIKVDREGNEEWTKEYGGPAEEGGGGIVQADDGGYFIICQTESYGAGQNDYYLVRTDSLGNEIWTKTYGTASRDWGWSITKLSDGNLILSGGRETKAQLIKVDTAGNVIWQKFYKYSGHQSSFLCWTQELANGNLIAGGATFSYNENQSDWGYVICITKYGELIWERAYLNSNGSDFFYYLIPTFDGGALLSGHTSTNTTGQDGWLFKVDSMGCLIPGCQFIGVEENQSNFFNTQFLVYPNPAKDFLVMEFQNASCTDFLLKIFDITGRMVVERSNIQSNRVELSIQNVPPGIYLYTLISEYENKQYTGKFIIE